MAENPNGAWCLYGENKMKSEDAMKFVGYGLIISIGVVLIIIEKRRKTTAL